MLYIYIEKHTIVFVEQMASTHFAHNLNNFYQPLKRRLAEQLNNSLNINLLFVIYN